MSSNYKSWYSRLVLEKYITELITKCNIKKTDLLNNSLNLNLEFNHRQYKVIKISNDNNKKQLIINFTDAHTYFIHNFIDDYNQCSVCLEECNNILL